MLALNPDKGVEEWSYAAKVDAITHDHFVEIDLVVPELAGDDASMRTPWYPLVAAAHNEQGTADDRPAPVIAGPRELGLVGAAFFAALLALVHAIFAIHLRADQIVSGTAINILAAGITAFAFQDIYGDTGTPNTATIPNVHIANVPVLKQVLEAINWVLQKIPGVSSIATGIGNVFDSQNLMTWIALFLVVLAWLFLFRTTWGLRLRAVGEHPRAADTVGISVFRWRYLAVMASGALAGLGGAYLSFGFLDAFTNQMTNGRGFIALAALVFGKWKPFGLLGATLLFGFASALGDQLQTNANISSDLVNILPYLFTLIALVGLVGRSTPPAADGQPYARQ